MTRLPLEGFDAANAKVDDVMLRAFWSGAAANGAWLLGLISLAGQAPTLDAGVQTLTVPIAMSAAGFWMGTKAIQRSMNVAALRMVEAVHRARIDRAHGELQALHDALAADTARLRAKRDELRERVRELGGDSDLPTEPASAPPPEALPTRPETQEATDAIEELKAVYAKIQAAIASGTNWLVTSLTVAAGSVAALLIAAWL